jgi:hypothetical protein
MKNIDPFDFSITNDEPEEEIADNDSHRRRSEVLIRSTKNIYRRAFSETQLLDISPKEFKNNISCHYITSGDVDALSYLKIILRQQNLEHCLFSTWCMAGDDILQFEEWLKNGKIKKLDAYLGEIFPKSYLYEWKKINEIFEKYNCGKIAVFRNHSKIFAGYGEKFYFGIETSANINTNPRTENGCITIGKDIYEFYKSYFDGIVSFIK